MAASVFTPESYESDAVLNVYLQFHFGKVPDLYPYATFTDQVGEALAFCRNVVRKFRDHPPARATGRALDLGCAVGGSCFELSKHFSEVLGVDLSGHFIAAADRIRTERKLAYEAAFQGETTRRRVAELDPGANPSRVTFVVGDAARLDPAFGTFDAVLCCNLLDRVNEPRRLLDSLPALLNPGGTLVFLAPYSWSENYTPRERWIGGHRGDARRCEAQLVEIMSANGLQLLEEDDVPFVIPEHIRRFQLGVSHCTVWRK